MNSRDTFIPPHVLPELLRRVKDIRALVRQLGEDHLDVASARAATVNHLLHSGLASSRRTAQMWLKGALEDSYRTETTPGHLYTTLLDEDPAQELADMVLERETVFSGRYRV